MPWKKIIVNVHGFSVLQQNFNRADITFLTKIFLGRGKKSYAKDIPLLPGSLSSLCSVAHCLAPAPLKLRPYGAIQIHNSFFSCDNAILYQRPLSTTSPVFSVFQ